MPERNYLIAVIFLILFSAAEFALADVQVIANSKQVYRVVGSPQTGYWAVPTYRHALPPKNLTLAALPDSCSASNKQKFNTWFSEKLDQLRRQKNAKVGTYRLYTVPQSGALIITFLGGAIFHYNCEQISEIAFPHATPTSRKLVDFLGQLNDGALWFKYDLTTEPHFNHQRMPSTIDVVYYRLKDGQIQSLKFPQALSQLSDNKPATDRSALLTICDMSRLPYPKTALTTRWVLCMDSNMRLHKFPRHQYLHTNASGVFPLTGRMAIAFDQNTSHADNTKNYRFLESVCLQQDVSLCQKPLLNRGFGLDDGPYRGSIVSQTILPYDRSVYFVSKTGVGVVNKQGVYNLHHFPKPVAKRSVNIATSGAKHLLVTTPAFIYRIEL